MSILRRVVSQAITLSLLFLLNILFLESNAQAPNSINYQAIARDLNGNTIQGQTGSINFKIRSTTSTGMIVYEEEHMVTTNSYGHFNVRIGEGTQIGTALFDDIDWGGSAHFLQVTIDFFGSQDLGTTELVSVPYALYAKTSGNTLVGKGGIQINGDTIENIGDTSNTNELVTQFFLNGSNELVLQEGSNAPQNVDLSSLMAGNDSLNVDSVRGDLVYLSVIGGNQVLFSVRDDDSDALNEIQTLSLNGTQDTIFLSNQGGSIAIADLGLVDITQLNDVRNIAIQDSSDTNELIDSIRFSGNELRVFENGIQHTANLTSILGVDSMSNLTDSSIQVFNADGSRDTVIIPGKPNLDNSTTNELLDSMSMSSNRRFLRYYQQGVVDSVSLGLDTLGAIQRLNLFGRTNVNANDIDSIQKYFSIDSTALQQHLMADQDIDPFNEKVDSMDIQGNFLRVFEGGVLSDSVDLSSIVITADTSIKSGSIVGDSIVLVNSVGQNIAVNVSALATDSELGIEVGKLTSKIIQDSIVHAARINVNQSTILNNQALIAANTDSIGSVLDSLNKHLNLDRDTSINNERNLDFNFDGLTNILSIRDTAGTLSVNLSGLANVTGIDTVTSVSLINDNEIRIFSGDGDSATVDISSLATDAELFSDSLALAGNIAANATAISANTRGIIDTTNNLEASLLARINADSLARYINDTTLEGQLRDTSAVLRTLILNSGSDDQRLGFNTTMDTILLEDGGSISIKDIRDSIANYNARINSNVVDIMSNQSAIVANAQGIIDSTNNLESGLLARINADSLARFINDTTLEGQLRDTTAVLRTLIGSTNTDDQQISFNTAMDTILLEDGGSISIKDIRDSIANYNSRINTNATDITSNQTSIANIAARLISDSTRIANDSTNLANTILTATNLEVRFETDSALQDADSVRLDNFITQYGTDTTNISTRINTNATDITSNQTSIANNATRLISDSTRIANDSTNLANTILTATNLEVRFETDSALQDADSVRLDNFITQYGTDTTNISTRINTNATDITNNQTSIANNAARLISDSTRIANDSTNLANTILTATNLEVRFETDSALQDADSVRLDNFITQYGTDTTNISTRINTNATDITNNQTSIANNAARLISDSTRIANDSTNLANTILTATNLEVRFETDSALQDADSVRLDNFITQYGTDTTNISTRINTNATDITSNQTSIANNAARLISDSTRIANDSTNLANTILTATNLEVRFETDSALQDADSVRLDNFITQYGTDTTNISTRINTNATDITNNQTSIANNAARLISDSTRIANDSTNLANTILTATNLEVRFETDSALQDADSVRLDNFITQYGTDTTNISTRINTNATDITNNQTSIANNAARLISDSTRIANDSTNLANTILTATNLEVRFETDSALQDADSVRLDNFITQYGTDTTNISTRINTNATDITSNQTSIANNAARLISDSTRIANDSTNLANTILTATNLEVRFETDSALQDADSVRLDNFITQYGTDTTNISTRINTNATDITNNQTSIANNAARLISDSTRIANDSTNLANTILTATNLEVRFETDSALQDADSVRLDNFITQYGTDTTNISTRINTNATDITSNQTSIANNAARLISDSTRIANDSTNLANTILTATNLEVRFETDSALQDADSVRLDNFITQYGTDTTNISTRINTNATDITNNQTSIANNAARLISDSTRIANDSTNLANTILTATNLEVRFETDSALQVADSVRLDNFITQYGTDTTNISNRINTNQSDISTNQGSITTNTSNISSNTSMLSTVKSNFTADSTALQSHLTNDLDLSASNERVDSLDLNGNFLRIFENGTLSDSADLSSLNNSSPFSTTSNVTSNSSGDQANDDLVFGSPSLDNSANSDHYNRLFFDKSQGAFRVGRAAAFEWNSTSIGQYSAAFGEDNTASAVGTFAAGADNVASANFAAVFGDDNVVNGQHAFAGGSGNTIGGKYSVGFGQGNVVNGSATHSIVMGINNDVESSGIANIAMGSGDTTNNIYSIAMGHLNRADGTRSLALGSWLWSSGNGSFTIGVGIDNANRIANSIDNSLMVGFNSTIPTFYVGPSTGAGTFGQVGVGTTTTDSILTVNGGISADYINLSGGSPTVGQVLTVTNANGKAEWQTIAGTDTLDIIRANDSNYVQVNDGSTTIFTSNGGNGGVTFSTGKIAFDNGNNSLFIGNSAGNADNSSSANIGIGVRALTSNVSTSNNIAMGHDALRDLVSGGQNVAIGYHAGIDLDTASNNTLVGTFAGNNINKGSNNTYIGTRAGRLSSDVDGSVKIGYEAGNTDTRNNTLFIDNSGTSTPLIWGDFDNDSLKIFGNFSVGNEYSFPNADGAANQVLQTDGSGQLSFATISSGADNDWDTTATVVYNTSKQLGLGTISPASDFRSEISNGTSSSFRGGMLIRNNYDNSSTKVGLDIRSDSLSNTIEHMGIRTEYVDDNNTGLGSYYGIFNDIDRGSDTTKIGVYNHINTNSISNNYGTKSIIEGGSNVGRKYGSYVDLHNNASAAGAFGYVAKILNDDFSIPSYAFKASMSRTSNGLLYGVYVNGEDRNFFSGKVGIGAEPTARSLEVTGGASIDTLNINSAYTFPSADGNSNEVLKTDGSGNLTFVDAATLISSTDAQNLGVTADSITIDNGTGAYIGDIRDTLSAHNTRLNTNGTNIGTNTSSISANSTALGVEVTDRSTADAALSGRIANDSTNLANHLAADGDLSATNELQSLSYDGDSLRISGSNALRIRDIRDSSQTDLADSTAVLRGLIIAAGTDDQNISISAGKGTISLEDGGVITLNDSSATNELQSLSINTAGDTLFISNGNNLDIGRIRDSSLTDLSDTSAVLRGLIMAAGTDDQNISISAGKGTISLEDGGLITLNDSSATNEIQSLSYDGDSLRISAGNALRIRDIRDSSQTDLADSTSVLRGLIMAAGTDDQNISISVGKGTISLEDGGRVLLADSSETNELQSISRTGTTVTLSDGGGTFTDSTLSETDVDNMVSNNGFLMTEIDGSITNEIQTLSYDGDSLRISAGNALRIRDIRDSSQTDLADSTAVLRSLIMASGTDDQNLTLNNDVLSIEDGNSVSFKPVLDSMRVNRDSVNSYASRIEANTANLNSEISNRQTVDGALSTRIVNDSTNLANHLAADGDLSATNELQNLSINAAMDSLLLNNGTGVKLSDIQHAGDTISLIRSSDNNRYVETANSGEVVVGVNGSDRFKVKENSIEFTEKTVFIGQSAGTNQNFTNIPDSSANIAIGHQALMTNATSTGELAIGPQALMNSGSSASNNTAVGAMALRSNDNGTGGTAFGYRALRNVNSGSNNSGIGSQALGSLTSGAGNTALGSGAGSNLTSGGDNVFLGTNTGAAGSYSSRLYIDNTNGGSTPLIYGDLAEDSLVINGVLTVDSLKNGSGYTLPGIDGTANQVLRTDGSGKAFWSTVASDGNGIFSGTGSLSGNTEVTGGSNTLSFTSTLQNAVIFDTTTLIVDALNNRVGIGIGSPLAGLHVNSTDSIGSAVDVTYTGSALSTAFRAENTASSSIRRYAAQFISNQTHSRQNLGSFSYASGADSSFAGHFVAEGSGNVGSQAVGGIFTAEAAQQNFGVVADALSAPGDSAVAIYGVASGGGTNFAGFFGEGNVYVGDTLMIPTDAGLGKVLTSDAMGKALWAVPSTGLKSSGIINKLGYFAASDSLAADNNLHWDATNSRLGIGTSSPTANIQSWDTTTAGTGIGMRSFLYTNTGDNLYGMRTEVEHTRLSSDTAFGVHSYVYGSSGSITKYGVYSKAAGGAFAPYFGVYGSGAGQQKSYGVYGSATGSDENFGVYGTASGGTGANWAGYFNNGDVFINDTLRLNNPFILGDNAAAGRVLTSDANGVATWQTLAAGGGGVFEKVGGVIRDTTSDYSSDFVIGSSQLDSSGVGQYYRLIFDKSLGFFGAGYADATEWDEANRGFGSAAFGFNNTANGVGAFASGSGNIASGGSATTIGGQNNTASGNNSFISGGSNNTVTADNSSIVGGTNNRATAELSVVSGGSINYADGNRSSIVGGQENKARGAFTFIGGGIHNIAQSRNEIVLGAYNDTLLSGFNQTAWVATDRLFVLGNGTGSGALSNALVILKNGNTFLNGDLNLSNGTDTLNFSDFGNGASNGDVLTFQNDSAVWSPTVGDNLGNHTATTNIQLGNNYLTNDGDNEGLSVNPTGEVSFSSTTGIALTVAKGGGGESLLMEMQSYGSGNNAGSILDLYNARGNSGAKTSVLNGDRLFTIKSKAFYDATNVVDNELMTSSVDGTVTTNIVPTRTDFMTVNTAGASTTLLTLRASGNVGISDTDPDSALSVGGGIEADAIRLRDNAGAGKVLISDASGNASWSNTSAVTPWTTNVDTIYNISKYVGIGTTNPAALMAIRNTNISDFGLEVVTDKATSNTIIGLFGGATGAGTGMKYGGYFDSQASGGSQNIGAYSIVGNASTNNIGFWGQGSTTVGNEARGLQGQSSGGGQNIGLYAKASGGTANWAAFLDTGNVFIRDSLGIGTSSPSYPFHLTSTGNTTARIDAASNSRAALQFAEVSGAFGTAATGFEASYNGSDDKFMFRSANSGTIDTVLSMDRSTGFVGIQNHSPSATLHVGGAIKVDTVVATPMAGMIQWTGADFQGYDGGNWQSLTTSNSTCPGGMTNVGGNMCIETAERTASDWFDAASTCMAAGYKLPTWAEWYGAMDNASLTDETDDWEWVSDGTSNTARKVGNGGLKNTANDDPDTGSEVFRCVFYLK